MSAPDFTGRAILIDSNLSVLLCVGLADTGLIRSHKRLGSYDETDFDILKEIVDGASELVICPNVASETFNLTRQIGGPARNQIAEVLRGVIEEAREVYVESRNAAQDPNYLRLGLTDVVLLCMLDAQESLILVTADHNLHVAAASRRLAAVNFNHLRERRPDFE